VRDLLFYYVLSVSERQHNLRVATSESVNRLIVVTASEEVFGQKRNQRKVCGCNILKLVGKNVGVSFAVSLAEIKINLKEVRGVDNYVLKIDSVCFSFKTFVLFGKCSRHKIVKRNWIKYPSGDLTFRSHDCLFYGVETVAEILEIGTYSC